MWILRDEEERSMGKRWEGGIYRGRGGDHVRAARVGSFEKQRGIQVNYAVLRCYKAVGDLLRISH
jgi:hypothetical protein